MHALPCMVPPPSILPTPPVSGNLPLNFLVASGVTIRPVSCGTRVAALQDKVGFHQRKSYTRSVILIFFIE